MKKKIMSMLFEQVVLAAGTCWQDAENSADTATDAGADTAGPTDTYAALHAMNTAGGDGRTRQRAILTPRKSDFCIFQRRWFRHKQRFIELFGIEEKDESGREGRQHNG